MRKVIVFDSCYDCPHVRPRMLYETVMCAWMWKRVRPKHGWFPVWCPLQIYDPIELYLSRSVFCNSDGAVTNTIAEEAECGNDRAQIAMSEREKVLNGSAEKCSNSTQWRKQGKI